MGLTSKPLDSCLGSCPGALRLGPVSKRAAPWAIHSFWPILYLFSWDNVSLSCQIVLRCWFGVTQSHVGFMLRLGLRANDGPRTPGLELSSRLWLQCRLQSTALWVLSWDGWVMDITCTNRTALFTLPTALSRKLWERCTPHVCTYVCTHRHTHTQKGKKETKPLLSDKAISRARLRILLEAKNWVKYKELGERAGRRHWT